MWQHTAGRPPQSQPPKPLMAIRSSSGFSHFRSGVFHISLRTHKTQHTQPREWKKREQTNTDLGFLQAQEGRSLWHFPSILWAIAGVYSIKIPTKSPGTLAHPLTLANSASGSKNPSTRLPPTSVVCPVLSTSLFCPLLLTALGPSFLCPLPVSWEISRASCLCGFRAETDKEIFWLALTHTHATNAQHYVTLMC